MKIDIERLGDGPIIRPHMDARMGDNVNGPTLIKVPNWIENPLGKYYLYFGHHDGRYIRLAYAEDLQGPWQTHEPGVLPLEQSLFRGHIASPDVLVDHETKCIRLYYHGAPKPTHSGQKQFTRVALSADGLTFEAREEQLGLPYMRTIRHGGWYYAIAMPGQFYRSRDGLTNFESGPNPFEPGMRHAALLVQQDRLIVFYTQVGDTPERVLWSEIDLTRDWGDWTPTAPCLLLEPERAYEGGDLKLVASERGLAKGRVRQLRDPGVFDDGKGIFLLYSVAGEHGIAIAKLKPSED
jgi:hypothetical protein